MSRSSRLGILCLVCAGMLLVAWQRLQLSYDLGAFLPPPATPAQEVLSSRLGQGPGAQLIFVRLNNSNVAAAADTAGRLRQVAGVARVLPEPQAAGLSDMPAALWQHRAVLQEWPADRQAWRDILLNRLDDLALADDNSSLAMLTADPALFALNALAAFSAGVSQPRFDQGDVQYLIVQSAVPAYDVAGQARVLSALRAMLPAAPAAELFGNPVYAVDLQRMVRTEATLFSLLASILLAALMVFRYRSAYVVISVALPLAAGAVCGLLALTLLFDEVHGITLAFGFTLLGVAIDYPLHLFTHAAYRRVRLAVWPTLRLGVFSTLLAYGAFILSGTSGLRQLGVFGVFGITAAALSSAWLAPAAAAPAAHRTAPAEPPALRYLPALVLAAVSTLVLLNLQARHLLFNDNLASLTPVPAAVLAADADIRRHLGVTDIRYLLAVRSGNLEQTLQATEQTSAHLQELAAAGALDSFQAVTQILPSLARQQQRRARLQAQLQLPGGQNPFEQALAESDFVAGAFAPFREYWRQAGSAAPLTLEALNSSPPLAAAAGNLLYRDSRGWVSLIYLRNLHAVEQVRSTLHNTPKVQWIDLKSTAEAQVSAYREQLLQVLLLALAAIALLLVLAVKLRRQLWVLGTVAAAVAAAAAVIAAWQGGLSLFDLVALTLVAGLGLDYALFYSRPDGGPDTHDRQATTAAVSMCAISSLLVFGVLSLSSIPVLSGIGSTVSTGVLAAYLLARFSRQQKTGR